MSADPNTPQWTSEVVQRYTAPGVKQGAVVDDQYIYALSNRQIVKYRKDNGEKAGEWKDEPQGRFIHLNEGFIKDGKLYAAHSNYPNLPMKSSVEIWDAKALTPVDRHDFGETDGSLTWVSFHEGNWYAGFAHYAHTGGVPGRGPEHSRVVKYDDQWRPVKEWTYPEPLVKRFVGESASCGGFGPGGFLYVTGHDAKELYVLEIPSEGSVLNWINTIPVPFEGQAFGWDPKESDVIFGISRKNQQVIKTRVIALPAEGAAKVPELSLPRRGLCAHRGGCEDIFPENTLPAFKEAARLGAQMIEFDVWFSKDRALVIMHDPTVDRTTDGKGAIADLNLEEIRRLDAGFHRRPKFADTRVPTLEEALEVMPRNVWLNVHLKGTDVKLGEEVAKVIAKKNRLAQAFLACDQAMAVAARSVVPNILICNMQRRSDLSQYVAETIAEKANFIQLKDQHDLTEKDLLPLNEHGIHINYYAAKMPRPDELAGLLHTGVDFVLVNDVAAYLPAAKALEISPVDPSY